MHENGLLGFLPQVTQIPLKMFEIIVDLRY